MSDANAPSFRTRTGDCTVTAERIVILRRGFWGGLERVFMGSSAWQPLLLRLMMAALAATLALLGYQYGRWADMTLGGAAALAFLWEALAKRRRTAAILIARGDVEQVVVHHPSERALGGAVSIWYRSGRRLLERPVRFWSVAAAAGANEFPKAVRIFKDLGWPCADAPRGPELRQTK